MNLRQLRFICELVKHDLNVSAVAKTLNTNQSGVSKQLKMLETELGTQIFIRSRNRLSSVTPYGQTIISLAQEVLRGIANITAVGEDVKRDTAGSIVIGITHTQARHVLPEIIKRFNAQHPKVRIRMRHADPPQIIEMVLSGKVDIGITAYDPPKVRDLITLPFRQYQRILIVPKGHKLLRIPKVSLKDIVQYPIVTYESGYAARQQIVKVFEKEGLEPKIAISAIDDDVIKSCVEQGLGITVLSEVTFDASRDSNIKAISIKHLFEPYTTSIIISRQHYIRRHVFDFIELCAPHWGRANIQRIAGK